jgi:hypothetical protein
MKNCVKFCKSNIYLVYEQSKKERERKERIKDNENGREGGMKRKFSDKYDMDENTIFLS